MGKHKQHPRYNIISTRISDADLAELTRISNGRTNAELLQQALTALILSERQRHYDEHLRDRGL